MYFPPSTPLWWHSSQAYFLVMRTVQGSGLWLHRWAGWASSDPTRWRSLSRLYNPCIQQPSNNSSSHPLPDVRGSRAPLISGTPHSTVRAVEIDLPHHPWSPEKDASKVAVFRVKCFYACVCAYCRIIEYKLITMLSDEQVAANY